MSDDSFEKVFTTKVIIEILLLGQRHPIKKISRFIVENSQNLFQNSQKEFSTIQ